MSKTNFKLNENYIDLKKKLDSMNYLLPFDMSSMRLVDQLVNDLLKLRSEVSKTVIDKVSIQTKHENLELSFKALEHENSRLIKENSSLHKEMIELSTKLSN